MKSKLGEKLKGGPTYPVQGQELVAALTFTL